MKTVAKIILLAGLLICFAGPSSLARIRDIRAYPDVRGLSRMVKEKDLFHDVSFLCDSLCNGRATGTPGGVSASFFIMHGFRNAGLMPFDGLYTDGFVCPDGKTGHNVMGISPAAKRFSDGSYIVVAAHFDNFGVIDGRMFPGADSDASGTVALMNLARMHTHMRKLGRAHSKGVIFIAFDAKEKNSRGAEHFWNRLESGTLRDPSTGESITPDKIALMVNLDLVGSSLAPLSKGTDDYLLMLSDGQFVSELVGANYEQNLWLQIGIDYYGSRDFTNIFYNRIGDHKYFRAAGIPTVLFTSGITSLTNKQGDDPASLNYTVLRKRILLIYGWLDRMIG